MKTLYEGILADMEDTLSVGNNDVIVNCLYSHNWEQRFAAISDLKNLVESYKVKPIKQLSKLKDVNGYIVGFWHGISHNDTEYNYLRSTYKTDKNCYTLRVAGGKTHTPYSWHFVDWKYIKKEYDIKNGLVYIVPDELKELFDILYKSKERQ